MVSTLTLCGLIVQTSTTITKDENWAKKNSKERKRIDEIHVKEAWNENRWVIEEEKQHSNRPTNKYETMNDTIQSSHHTPQYYNVIWKTGKKSLL